MSASPLQCMMGCSSCEVWRIFDAINFHDKKIVKNFIKKNNVLQKAREELEELMQGLDSGG